MVEISYRQYIGLLNHPDIKKTDISSIRGCFSGSAPLPVEVIRDFESKTGAVIVEGYGLTETTPVTHINPLNREKRKIGSIGLPVSYRFAIGFIQSWVVGQIY